MHLADCGKDQILYFIKTRREECRISVSKFPLQEIWPPKLWFPMPVNVSCDKLCI